MNGFVYIQSVFLTVVLISLQGHVNGLKKYKINYELPPLYKFDPYDSCLDAKNTKLSSTYCMVYAEIKPENNSQIWQKISKHTAEYKFHYRRDRLFFGVCLERCKQFGYSTDNSLNEEEILKNENTEYFDNVHKRPLDLVVREKYHALIHNCINREFQNNYGLNLRTYIEYCERPKGLTQIEQEPKEKDYLQSFLFKVLGVIAILNIFSTFYDFCLKKQQPEENQSNEFYKINPQAPASQLLTSFSICRNYYRLIQPYFGEVGKDLSFLDGFRSVCTMLVLYGHTFFMEYQHLSNPEYFENNAKTQLQVAFLNTTMAIEIFFFMSGLLLYIKFQQGHYVNPQTGFKKLFKTYVQLVIARYIRFIPSVGLFILTNATILTRLQNGPFWRHITEPARIFSREKGWQNLVMLNNFAGKESASPHTWYVAADMQLFAVYLLVLMVIARYPKYKKHIFTTLAILTFAVPFCISYMLKLDPGFIIHPECYRYLFFKDVAVYYKIYQPFYTNLGGYLFGIICGELYMKYTCKEEIRIQFRGKLKYEIGGWIITLPVVPLIFWLGGILVLKEPSIWSALYAGLHRMAWVLIVCGIPFLGMSCKGGGIAYEFCCLPIFRFLSRLSFQVYLWHMTIIYLICGYQRQPVYVNTFYFLEVFNTKSKQNFPFIVIFTQVILLYVLSNLLAFFIALFMEYPIAQMVQVLQSSSKSKNVKKS